MSTPKLSPAQKEVIRKLRDPIKPDTIITVMHYRIITGACETGVNNWLDETFTEKEKAKYLKSGIKAKDLLPILERTNAYQKDKFKELITF